MTAHINNDQIQRNVSLGFGAIATGTLAYYHKRYSVAIPLILLGGHFILNGAIYPTYKKITTSWENTKQSIQNIQFTPKGAATVGGVCAILPSTVVQLSSSDSYFSLTNLVFVLGTLGALYYATSQPAASLYQDISISTTDVFANEITKNSCLHLDSSSIDKIKDTQLVLENTHSTIQKRYSETGITYLTPLQAFEGTKFLDEYRAENPEQFNKKSAEEIRQHGLAHPEFLKKHWQNNYKPSKSEVDNGQSVYNRTKKKLDQLFEHKFGLRSNKTATHCQKRCRNLLIQECRDPKKGDLSGDPAEWEFNLNIKHPRIEGIDSNLITLCLKRAFDAVRDQMGGERSSSSSNRWNSRVRFEPPPSVTPVVTEF